MESTVESPVVETQEPAEKVQVQAVAEISGATKAKVVDAAGARPGESLMPYDLEGSPQPEFPRSPGIPEDFFSLF